MINDVRAVVASSPDLTPHELFMAEHIAEHMRASTFEPWEVERLQGAIDFMREAWRSNDGAEGESVKLVCAALEKLLPNATKAET
jgi:hypothetical protein